MTVRPPTAAPVVGSYCGALATPAPDDDAGAGEGGDCCGGGDAEGDDRDVVLTAPAAHFPPYGRIFHLR